MHPFPSGRKRREVLRDPLTGQSFQSYEGKVEQIGDIPLLNDTTINNDISIGGDNDKFDDQFEEDLEKASELYNDEVAKSDDEFDVSLSRWLAYDSLTSLLGR